MKNDWINNLKDEDFKKVFTHPDIIKCKDCKFICEGFICSNIYSYPKMPQNFGCKNGILKCKKPINKKSNLLNKIKCKLGYHQEICIGKYYPYLFDFLFKCECCNKYGLYNRNLNYTLWIKESEKEQFLTKSCLEMIEKYQL